MAWMEHFKQESKAEYTKLKDMSGKDRLWYIWEYYKFHIGAVFAFLFLVSVIISTLYRNSFETAFYCMYLNNRSEMSLNTDPLETGFSEYLNLGKKQKIYTESSYISYGEDATQFSYASMAKISALVATRDLDLIIGDQQNLEHYASMGGFENLAEFIPPGLMPLLESRLVYFPDENGVEKAFGISLNGTDFAIQSNLDNNACLLGIISNSKRKDTSLLFLHYIFAPQT